MSKTALEIAKENYEIAYVIETGKEDSEEFYYTFNQEDFNKFCEALCREQRRICALTLEAVALSPEKDVYEVVNNAPTPKWREE